MKKKTIWTIAIAMGASFLVLLYLQTRYFEQVVRMRSEQFAEAVGRALYQVAYELEEESEAATATGNAGRQEPEGEAGKTAAEAGDTTTLTSHEGTGGTAPYTPPPRRERRYGAAVGTQAPYSAAGSRTLKERLGGLEGDLARALRNNGIDEDGLVYHYYVTDALGDTVCRCADYDARGEERSFTQVLFANDAAGRQGVLNIHFPGMVRYVFTGVQFIVPALLFTFVLLCMFVFTIYTIFRQKRLTEIKNDFINNMTHEFKTPISTISLAAQMLNDPSVTKNEGMLRHVAGIINDETKRLRFQVEKVLQMSLFDEKGGTYTQRELHLNKILEDVAKTFRLKVESAGGTITTQLEADEDTVYGDEMHLTNVLFNLMDNAVKYKHPEQPLQITLTSANRSGRIAVTVRDNGIGIKREDLKKIFEKFYRAHTGNRHDVKGFGLGLAYVKKVVSFHQGTIQADSTPGKGTAFLITLPILKESKH
ncbi:MAG: HAMP domain-containing histidine kinase [Alloprevotella sp.]|nr:HAMP domain-containing histidine kinase [Alloprevotella sp.]